MTETALPPRRELADRWPTAVAMVAIAVAVAVMVLLDGEAELFGPAIAVMAGIYLMAYALGRPSTAWLAFVVLSAVVSVLHILDGRQVSGVDPAVGMTIVLVLLWLWTVARRRFTEARTFSIQTAGMVGFGVLTLLCTAVAPRLGIVLAGVGFLAHGAWDAYHFRVNRVVNRPWSEFCAVVDLGVGVALIVVATA
ncbi:hypothetical protein [Plantactinospora soyae]|uniref:Membrane protease YdiL (CAAX protease family) n=1 Tax=Plantactinospora soyae TaxID=1544732 RepID=A0A927R1X7_9ACTN|nr:hypothetical protein [Plantactinospora soyae]MBE1490183.1 membrane protease YdiL (CAAX protease family) [Plantactinospora soyae]